jgi:probable F420-dependent oxidoreductase
MLKYSTQNLNHMPKIEFGVRLPVSGPLADIEVIKKIALRAEEIGFDSIWVNDHIVWTKYTHKHHISTGSAEALNGMEEPNFFEALTTLAFLAGITRRVKLGVACVVLPCRNPVYLAKQAANIDILSNGRLILGVGLGSRATILANEFSVLNYSLESRTERFEEYVRILKEVWTKPVASFSGKHYRFDNAEIFPKPIQKPHIPIWVGGWSKASMIRALKLAEGWIPGWLTTYEMAKRINEMKELATYYGRKSDELTVAVEKYLCLSRNRDEARAKALNTIKQSLATYERHVKDLGFALDVHIVGGIEEVEDKIKRFVEAGVTHFEFKFIYNSLDEFIGMMELFADTVMTRI